MASGYLMMVETNNTRYTARLVLVLRGITLFISLYIHVPQEPRLCAWPAPEDPCRPERRGCEGELSGSVGQSLAQQQQGKSARDCRLHRQMDHRIDIVDQSLCIETISKHAIGLFSWTLRN